MTILIECKDGSQETWTGVVDYHLEHNQDTDTKDGVISFTVRSPDGMSEVAVNRSLHEISKMQFNF